MTTADALDPNRMDIDPPEPSPADWTGPATADSTGPPTPNSFTTASPTADTSPAMDGEKTSPWDIPASAKNAAGGDDKGKGRGMEDDTPAPPPEPKAKPKPEPKKGPEAQPKPEPEPEVDISHVPPPDLKALLSKSRDPGAHLDATRLAVPELRALLDKALKLKADGNKNFTSKPPKLEAARDSYLCALDCLPAVPKHLPPPSLDEDRFVEITDEQAEQIERDWEAGPERVAVDNDIRDAEKALWGNLGAVYGQQKLYKEEVEACTRALQLDPHYIKALHRRASANEHIGTWSALVSAQRDCQLLLTLLPPDSTVATGVSKALDTLPKRIGVARKREEAEIGVKMGGLSTN